jgi:hypothetical protein
MSASTTSVNRVADTPCSGEMGDDLTGTLLLPITSIAFLSESNDSRRYSRTSALVRTASGPLSSPAEDGGSPPQCSGRQDIVCCCQMFDLLTEGAHTLEFAVCRKREL